MSQPKAHLWAGTPISQLQLGFSTYCRRLAENTVRGLEGTLCKFFATCPEIYEQITAEHIERFVMNYPGKASTRNNQLYRLRTFFRYAEDYHGLPNPASRIKPLRVSLYKQRCITDDEYVAILAVCNQVEKAVVRLLANTGLRRSEYQSLTSASISADKTHLKIIGKGDRLRTIPLNDISRKALSLLNLSKNFKKPESLMALCRKLSRKSGVEPFSPHAFRHYFCTRLIRAGVPIGLVSKSMGHANIAITLKCYEHLLDPDVLGITDCLNY